jgi:SAM-dependent methyltransferase
MSFSKEYADVYDSLYQEKDYGKECDYIEALLHGYHCRPNTILDLGCGTGSHALILAGRGYEVTGVDRSGAMLEIARKRAAAAGLKIAFREGDMTSLSLHEKYDAVVSLFSVMGFHTTDDALAAALRTVRNALVPGGMFVFDCWNGYAVMQDRPAACLKEVAAGDGARILRLSLPEIDIMNQVVHVKMRLWHIRGNEFTETSESQSVRFFYPREIRTFLVAAGFRHIDIYPFLSLDGALTTKDWSMIVSCS